MRSWLNRSRELSPSRYSRDPAPQTAAIELMELDYRSRNSSFDRIGGRHSAGTATLQVIEQAHLRRRAEVDDTSNPTSLSLVRLIDPAQWREARSEGQ